jgi:hypothetical protein
MAASEAFEAAYVTGPRLNGDRHRQRVWQASGRIKGRLGY